MAAMRLFSRLRQLLDVFGTPADGDALAWDGANGRAHFIGRNAANGYAGLDANGNLVGTLIPLRATEAAIGAQVGTAGEIATSSDTNVLTIFDGVTGGGKKALMVDAPQALPAAGVKTFAADQQILDNSFNVFLIGNDDSALLNGAPISFFYDSIKGEFELTDENGLGGLFVPFAAAFIRGEQWVSGPARPQMLADAATINWNINAGASTQGGEFATITLGGNRTLANPTGVFDGHRLTLIVKQDATGGRLLSWGTNFIWPGGIAPALSPSANDITVFHFVVQGGEIYPVCPAARADGVLQANGDVDAAGMLHIGSNRLSIQQNPAAPSQLVLNSHFTTAPGIVAGFGGVAISDASVASYVPSSGGTGLRATDFSSGTGHLLMLLKNNGFTLCDFTGDGLHSRFDISGSFLNKTVASRHNIDAAPAAAPADSDLPDGALAAYLDETGNNLKFRVRYSSGIFKTGTVALA